MALAPEAVQPDRDPERQHPESAVREAAVQDASLRPLGGAFSVLGGDGSGESNARLGALLQRRASGEMRTQIMRRVQQGAGNYKAQHLVAQMRRSSVIQRECSCGGSCAACQERVVEEEEPTILQRQSLSFGAGGAVDANVIPAGSPGQSLDPGTRAFMEPRFGSDFSDVRVHTDSLAAQSADALAANAYTAGRDIYFAAGKYSPSSSEGRHLLAHELTHTVQQESNGFAVAPSRDGEVMVGDAAGLLELEAESAANVVARGGTATIAAGNPTIVQRQQVAEPSLDGLPDPVNVVWGGDPFRISFQRKSEGLPYLYFIVQYTGPFPADGVFIKDKTLTLLRVDIDQKPLNARIQSQTDKALALDLYGFGDFIVRLADEILFDPTHQKGRGHDFAVKFLGDTRINQTIWIQDPKAAPTVQQPLFTKQPDIPGENPSSQLIFTDTDTITEIRIDADGDQMKELRVRLSGTSFWPVENDLKDRVKGVHLEIAQISSQQIRYSDFVLPEPTIQGALFPFVQEVTDGRIPTKISLIRPSGAQFIWIYPPTRDEKGVTYLVQTPAGRVNFSFPPEATPLNKIATASPPAWIGGISYVDFTLGAYNDKFRLTVQSTSTTLKDVGSIKANLGIAGLYRGVAASGAAGAEITLNRAPNLKLLDSSPVSLRIDVDGDKDHVIEIFDQLTTPASFDGGGPPEKNRNHTIRILGTGFGEKTFSFTIRQGSAPRGGFENPGPADKAAESNALAVSGLSSQKAEGNFQDLLDAHESALAPIRLKAVQDGVILQKTYSAWKALSDSLIRLRPMIKVNQVDGGLQASAAARGSELYSDLAEETKGREKELTSFADDSGISNYVNPYTNEYSTFAPFYSRVTPGEGAALAQQILMRQWDTAYTTYRTLVQGLDRWIVDRIKEKDKTGSSPESQRAELIGARRDALGAIASHNPIRILAVFHPDEKFKTDFGYVSEIPLALFAWQEGNKWYLRDLTNPQKPYDWSYSGPDVDGTPPLRLLSEMDDPDHFPAGVIHFDIPGQYGGQQKTTDHLTWKKFLSYLGLGVAAVGLTLATFGTGTVAVIGGYALAASALIGAAGAGIDLAEGLQHGDLDTKRVVLDLGTIVASLAGVSQLRSGLIVREALTAAEAARPLTGAAAEYAVFHGKVYVVSTSIRLVADGVTLLAFEQTVWDQLKAIDKAPGTDEDKARARRLLIAEGLGSAGMLALAVKGELPQLGGDRTLILHFPVEGGPPVANVGGFESPTALKFSQADVDPLTGDKTLTIEQLAESMKAGWKGEALNVVELPDGTLVSTDNRRLLAAQKAGISKIPVAYHLPDEPFPEGRPGFKLKNNIRELSDGTLVKGGKEGVIKYRKGVEPKNWGEAALFRTANQDIKGGGKFPLFGRYEQPVIRQPKPVTPPPGPGESNEGD